MSYNSRLFNEPKLRQIVELTDSISDECTSVSDALADYESAADMPASERKEARDDAREAAFSAIGDLLSEASELRKVYEQLELPS